VRDGLITRKFRAFSGNGRRKTALFLFFKDFYYFLDSRVVYFVFSSKIGLVLAPPVYGLISVKCQKDSFKKRKNNKPQHTTPAQRFH
jgi:hypothetical protein